MRPVTFVPLIAALALLSSCQTTLKSAATSTPAAPPEPPVVSVRKISRSTLHRETALTAEFRPYQQVDVHAKISGYVRQIPVDIGREVQAGELIAVLDAPELEAEIAQASAARNRAESEITRARAEIERAKAAVAVSQATHQRLAKVNQVEAGLIAQQELDEAMARSKSAEAHAAVTAAQLETALREVETLRAAEKRLHVLHEYTRVVAPFAGVITKRFADPGAMIQSGVSSHSQALPLVRIAEIRRLRLAVMVPESVTGALRLGQQATIRIPALTSEMKGRIDRFSSNLASNSRNTEVEIDVPNPTRRILPGMAAEVRIAVDSRPDTLTVPIQALSNLGGNRYVMTAGPDGILAEKQIQTGFESASQVEVLAGLDPDDLIVTGNRTLLRAGMKVQTKQEVD